MDLTRGKYEKWTQIRLFQYMQNIRSFIYLGIRCDLKRASITINRARANALIKTGKISSFTSPKGSVLGSSLDYILARFLISIRLINY